MYLFRSKTLRHNILMMLKVSLQKSNNLLKKMKEKFPSLISSVKTVIMISFKLTRSPRIPGRQLEAIHKRKEKFS